MEQCGAILQHDQGCKPVMRPEFIFENGGVAYVVDPTAHQRCGAPAGASQQHASGALRVVHLSGGTSGRAWGATL